MLCETCETIELELLDNEEEINMDIDFEGEIIYGNPNDTVIVGGIVKVENINHELIITLSDGSIINLGNIKGEDGINGKDGVGIVKTEINAEGALIIKYSDDTMANLGIIVGKDGANGVDGKDGIGVTKTKINEKGELVITYSNETSVNLGVVVGVNGKDGVNGTDGRDGVDGAKGVDGLTPFINNVGNWQIGDVDTGVKAEGDKGDQGDPASNIIKSVNGYTGIVQLTASDVDALSSDDAVKNFGRVNARLDEINTALGDIDTALDELHNYAQSLISGGATE